ncbi:MAG: p-cumate 2,3-dioxygenase ferredoxin subunit [Gammaproteobacteria bacterium]|jgi:p-cumate 2,3-dioxygenase ferredoxin subunit
MPEIKAFNASDLAPNEIRQLIVDGRPPIAVYNLDGEYFATDDTCTHGDASLAEGDIDGDEIVCPFHMGTFDIRTGEACSAPCAFPLKTHTVRVDDDVIYIEIDA